MQETAIGVTATNVSPNKSIKMKQKKLQLEIPRRGVHTGVTGEIAHNSNAHKKNRSEYVALRNVTLVLIMAQDNASSKTYINSDVAAELGLQGEDRRVTVNVLSGHTDSFETKIFELKLQSADGKINVNKAAFIA